MKIDIEKIETRIDSFIFYEFVEEHYIFKPIYRLFIYVGNYEIGEIYLKEKYTLNEIFLKIPKMYKKCIEDFKEKGLI